MPTPQQLRERLLNKLSELFQLDQPDLDFGFYRIMHAKAQEVHDFIANDLLQIVADAFGQADDARKAELQAAYDKAVQTAKEFGAPNPEETEPVKKAKAALDALKDTAGNEADVYDHLYRFFERYYDDGDFISRRYFARETDGKAAPFAIPYNGEEVKLHWANADQYYIKTAESFSNYTFDVMQAKEVRGLSDGERLALQVPEQGSRKVHFRIVSATEGEHGNVKASDSTKRFFIIHTPKPVDMTEDGELVVNFEYRPDPEKTGQEGSWRDKRNAEAQETILERLDALVAELREAGNPNATATGEYLRLLKVPAPTDKDAKRPVLAKYLNQYTASNTMDYFIHKDLGGFLRRELDFYIKNEVMQLDDIENADAPAVETYLSKIRVLRKIAAKLIDFLAQLEDFQKKLWLKKKFVVETNYCITLDRVPEALYPEIAANEAQMNEWVTLFAIDEIVASLTAPAFSRPLTVEFLKANDKLVLDTKFFSDAFKMALVASIEDFDEQCDGVLVHSENFQALNMLQERYREQVKCVYIDPPYNTGGDGFAYKDSYQHSSWLTSTRDRLALCQYMQSHEAYIAVSIDDIEFSKLNIILRDVFGENNELGVLVWDRNRKNDAKFFSVGHEYMLVYCKDKELLRQNKTKLRELKPGIDSSEKKFKSLFKKLSGNIEEVRNEWRSYIQSLKDPEIKSILSKYPKICDRGPYRTDGNINWPGKGGPRYEIIHPVTNRPVKVPKSGWRYASAERFWEEYDKGRISFGDDESTVPGVIYYLFENSEQVMGSVFWSYAQSTYEEFLAITGERSFENPKDVKDISRIVGYLSHSSGTVLDYFAGSGTTGHAVVNLNREDSGSRRYILIEMGDHFDSVLKPRMVKVVYSDSWKDGKPTSRTSGVSHCFKYLRLESYEDTLNNLRIDNNPIRKKAVAGNPALKEDYILRYMLNVETRGSQSLLNIDAFADPTAYTLEVKKPGTDEYATRTVDLVETFNYLIGLRVQKISKPQRFTAAFTRLPDPELPEDQNTKLTVDGKITPAEDGAWWFRMVEGWVPKDSANPNNGHRDKVLIVWRNLTGNLEQDNAVLDEWFLRNRIKPTDGEYDIIYANGSNNLPNLRKEGEEWKVRLLEEEFMKRMWDIEA